MAKRKPAGTYAVGFCRPPTATQFKKGQSGNPSGRPKGSKNFATEVKEAFGRKIVIQENGRTRRIPARMGFLMKLGAQALRGDMSALRMAIGLAQTGDHEAVPADIFSSESDREILRTFLAENAPAPPKRRRKGARK